MGNLKSQLEELEGAKSGVAAAAHIDIIGEDPEVFREMARVIGGRRNSDNKQIHAGFGGFINLDLFVLGKKDGLLLLDLNDNQIALWREVLDIIKFAETPNAFYKILRQLIKYSDGQFSFSKESISFPVRPLDFTKLLDFEFLSSPRAYNKLKDAVINEMVQAIMLDATDYERAKLITSQLQQGGFELASLYTTNLRDGFNGDTDYYGRSNSGAQGLRSFNATMQTLKSKGTILIDGSISRGGGFESRNYRY
jgi:hypothetical protein